MLAETFPLGLATYVHYWREYAILIAISPCSASRMHSYSRSMSFYIDGGKQDPPEHSVYIEPDSHLFCNRGEFSPG